MYRAPKSELEAQSCLVEEGMTWKLLFLCSIVTFVQLNKQRSVGNWLESEARCRWRGVDHQGPPGAGHPGQPAQRCHFRFLSRQFSPIRTVIYLSIGGENRGWSWARFKLRSYSMPWIRRSSLNKVLGKISGKAVVKPRFGSFWVLVHYIC